MLIVLIAVAVMLTVTACTSCNKNTQMPEPSLVIKGLTLGDNGEYRLNVGNAVETFSLKDVIQADRSTRFVISTDKAGENIVKDKATLTVGDNVFYVTASLGEATRIYTIRIRRLGSYTVSFDTDGGRHLQAEL